MIWGYPYFWKHPYIGHSFVTDCHIQPESLMQADFKISSKFLQDSPKSSWYNPSVFVTPARGVTFYILWSQVPVGGLQCDALLVNLKDDWMIGVGFLWWFLINGIILTFRLWLKPDVCCFIGRSGILWSMEVVGKIDRHRGFSKFCCMLSFLQMGYF